MTSATTGPQRASRHQAKPPSHEGTIWARGRKDTGTSVAAGHSPEKAPKAHSGATLGRVSVGGGLPLAGVSMAFRGVWRCSGSDSDSKGSLWWQGWKVLQLTPHSENHPWAKGRKRNSSSEERQLGPSKSDSTKAVRRDGEGGSSETALPLTTRIH